MQRALILADRSMALATTSVRPIRPLLPGHRRRRTNASRQRDRGSKVYPGSQVKSARRRNGRRDYQLVVTGRTPAAKLRDLTRAGAFASRPIHKRFSRVSGSIVSAASMTARRTSKFASAIRTPAMPVDGFWHGQSQTRFSFEVRNARGADQARLQRPARATAHRKGRGRFPLSLFGL